MGVGCSSGVGTVVLLGHTTDLYILGTDYCMATGKIMRGFSMTSWPQWGREGSGVALIDADTL